MREAFHDQLDGIFADLSDICGQVEVAVREATKALLTGDVHTADQVISNDKAIDAARERVDDTSFALLSLQQPVAGDLRMIVSALRMVSELERMGDLSVHVAKIARLRVPSVAVPDELRPTMEQMARTAEDMVRRDYFAHTSPGGRTLKERVRAAGYGKRGQGWRAGENIGWGTGTRATPNALVDAWLESDGHRRILLSDDYRELGIGVASGAPNKDAPGATYTLNVGVLR